MLRLAASSFAVVLVVLVGCSGSGYAVRPVPRIVADSVGKPVSGLQEAFGEPRKVDVTPTKLISVRFPGLRDGSHRRCALAARFGIFALEHRLVCLQRRAASHSRGAALKGLRASGVTRERRPARAGGAYRRHVLAARTGGAYR
jgi:hypothetical protein